MNVNKIHILLVHVGLTLKMLRADLNGPTFTYPGMLRADLNGPAFKPFKTLEDLTFFHIFVRDNEATCLQSHVGMFTPIR